MQYSLMQNDMELLTTLQPRGNFHVENKKNGTRDGNLQLSSEL